MKGAVIAVVTFLAAGLLYAQEAEVEPIVVTGTFELSRRPSVTDQFTQHLLRQVETHRLLEESAARSPWYYSDIWKYFPMRIESSSIDPTLFSKPQYLSLENQKMDWELRKMEKQSLFGR